MRSRLLNPEEAVRFPAAARSSPLHGLFALALDTGMRPGEYLALRWSDVNVRARTVTVQRGLVWMPDGSRFDEPKTAKGRRTLPIMTATAKALAAHRAAQAELRLQAGERWRDLGLVFAGPTGEPLDTRHALPTAFRAILRAAGVREDLRPYDLRHICATLLLATEVNAKVVAEGLGHASVSLTLDVYKAVLPNIQEAATERMAALLAGRT